MQAFWLDSITAAKWFFRSAKKGDWLWLMLAVTIASLSVTLVKQLGETVQQSMLLKAAESLGADLVLKSSRPIDPVWQQRAQDLGLQSAVSTELITMALAGTQFQLVQLKGVSNNYPLRGSVINKTPGDGWWIEPKVADLLPLTEHPNITMGQITLPVKGLFDRAQNFSPMSGFAPQIWTDLETLSRTQLIGPGSRVNYEMSFAGKPAQITALSKQLKVQNQAHWQIISAQAPNEDLEKSLNTAWLFLDLSALSAVLVAGMAILIASRFYLTRWQNSMALMRAFGANNIKMRRLFALQLTFIAFFSSLIGMGLGIGLWWLLTPLLGEYFTPLVLPNPRNAMAIGLISGILVLWSFAWQAFQSALQTSPMAVLKSVPKSPSGAHWFISFGLLLALISLMLGTVAVLWVVLGLLVMSLVLYGFAIGLLKVMSALQTNSVGWFRIALSNLLKEPGLVKVQLISVGLVLFVLMLMTFVRQDLLQNWQASLPATAPNTFVMNIQPDQLDTTQRILNDHNITPPLVPMARGRLTALNDQPLLASQQLEDRARRLLEREANIAILDTLPEHNVVVKQTTPSNAQTSALPNTLPNVSVEMGMAELFNIKLGDRLTFDFAGQAYDYQVASLREVEWQSFQLNFFFILEPVAERILPISYIGNFYIHDEATPQNQPGLVNQLTQSLAQHAPGVLLIDVKKIMQQIKDIMSQASVAVSALYGFTLLASLGVLFTATLASQQARVQSWLLLRTLGASNRTIFKIGLTEFALLGGLAGVLAATFAQITSVLVSVFLLDTSPTLNLGLWVVSLLSGTALLLTIGLITQARFLRHSPQQLKRYLDQH
ncbi:ABC transporter permease [Thiomicrorhabdus aquaedulcis]|uniref:ABC transporter permease n=1 Tax=Thiomicrorhabdus aquaedulcis TaxID=2211106 RepID=UPI000FDB566F|nr:FtsX-like permease family protein [Thiomicrorhabdus aquaedulcis]